MENGAYSRGSRDVVREDEEAVLAGHDTQTVALSKTENAGQYVNIRALIMTNLSKMWFCASAACLRAH